MDFQEDTKENLSFMLWVESKKETSAIKKMDNFMPYMVEGLLFYSTKKNLLLEYEGEVQVLNFGQRCNVFLSIRELLVEGRDECFAISSTISTPCLLTNMSGIECVFDQPIDFTLSKKYIAFIYNHKNNPVIMAVCQNNWFGIVKIYKTGFLRTRLSYHLVAFSTDTSTVVTKEFIFFYSNRQEKVGYINGFVSTNQSKVL